jgi:hypothetical protein
VQAVQEVHDGFALHLFILAAQFNDGAVHVLHGAAHLGFGLHLCGLEEP